MGDAKPGNCIYMAGAEATPGATHIGYETFTLQPAEYLICGFEANTFHELTYSALYKAQTFMSRFMEKHNLITTEFATEMYYPVTKDSVYMKHWMIAVPKA